MKKIKALYIAEWHSISRDLLLVITIVVPMLVAVFVRFAAPIAAGLLAVHADFDLSIHYEFIAGVAILVTPMMLGAMAGLQILDDRDERILSYISVTPLTREGYLAWKLSIPVLIGCALTPAAIMLMNLVPVKPGLVIPVTLLAALGAPVYAFMLPAFAANKVEGLAVAKASGLLMWAPFAGYLLPKPWPLLAGLFPPYWPVMAFVAGSRGQGYFWVYIAAGIVINLLWMVVMKHLFSKRIG